MGIRFRFRKDIRSSRNSHHLGRAASIGYSIQKIHKKTGWAVLVTLGMICKRHILFIFYRIYSADASTITGMDL